MSTAIVIILVAAIVFGLCRLVDKAFVKLFRSKAQHMSGLAVRANKRYGLFGVILSALGIMAICAGIKGDRVLLWGGVIVLLMGAGLAVFYLSFGVFYDQDSFLLSKFAKKSVAYRYDQIRGQKLYLIQGGNVVIELYLSDGNTLSLQSTMDGVYPFLDAAFAGWCRQTGREPEACDFHDPSQSLWFPTVEDV